MDNISVTIGHITKTYVLVETTAPIEYDGFGTFTINALGPKRWVLIEQEHFTWQTMRYGSGLHGHTVCHGKHLLRAAMQRLWERLVTPQGA